MNKFRVVSALLFLGSLFFLPWGFTFALLLIFMFLTLGKEYLFFGFLLDIVWGHTSPWYMRFTFFSITLLTFLLFSFLKQFIRKPGF